MKRRMFLRSAAGAALGGVALAPGCGRAPDDSEPGRSLGRIGLQLYTVRDLMRESVPGTLELVGGIGYREVEFAGYFGHTPVEIRSLLDANGLTAPSAHVPLEAFREGLGPLLDDAGVIGHRYVVLPYLAEQDRPSLDAYRGIADEMNAWGEACRAAGVQLAYHNHDFEFGELDGDIPYDVLLGRCDADLVKMEMDLYWTRVAGHDPLDYFARHPGRFHLCHVKDMLASGDMVAVGAGTIDFGAIFAQSGQAGLRHYFVEHDNPSDARASLVASHAHLASLSY